MSLALHAEKHIRFFSSDTTIPLKWSCNEWATGMLRKHCESLWGECAKRPPEKRHVFDITSIFVGTVYKLPEEAMISPDCAEPEKVLLGDNRSGLIQLNSHSVQADVTICYLGRSQPHVRLPVGGDLRLTKFPISQHKP